VCFAQRAREGKFHFFHHHWIVAHSEEKGSTRDAEVDLEERSGLGGDVDWEERSTLGGHGSDAHLTRVHLEDTTARSAPRGYGGQEDMTGTEDMAGRVSTVSLNRDNIAAAEENCEHRLVKPGLYSWSGRYGVDAAAEDREHRLVTPG